MMTLSQKIRDVMEDAANFTLGCSYLCSPKKTQIDMPQIDMPQIDPYFKI